MSRNPLADHIGWEGVGKVRRDWFRAYYGQLAGATIEAVRLDVREDEIGWPRGRLYAWPALIVRTKAGRRLLVVVRRDPEGRPGHLEIEPLAGQREIP